MGITGVLVKSIFSRNRSFGCHDNNGRNSSAEKRRRNPVRSYLCGDEVNSVLGEEDSASIMRSEATFSVSHPLDSVLGQGDSASIKPLDSILADEDSASVKSSEATVTQPAMEATETHIQKKQQNSVSKLFREEDAAVTIQAAFRQFLARRKIEKIPEKDETQEAFLRNESPSRESISTSIEVQTGNSVKNLPIEEETIYELRREQQKSRTQMSRIKENWDDSTVSSNISKMRLQNRLEAMTRREKALAYAFSQQLRICSKKRQTGSDEPEPSIGWSWLERWMATRVPETPSVDNSTNNQPETIIKSQRLVMKKRLFDVAKEEKESCGSNEVSVQLESLSSTTETDEKYGSRLRQDRLRARRSISKCKTMPSYQVERESSKLQVGKKNQQRETERAKKAKNSPTGPKN